MPDLLVSSGKSKVTEKQYLDRTCYHWQCFNKIFEFTFFLSHGSNTRDAVTLISKGWQFALGIVAAILMTACQWQQLYKASFPIIFLWSFAVFFFFLTASKWKWHKMHLGNRNPMGVHATKICSITLYKLLLFHANRPIKTETTNFLIAKFYIIAITKTVNSMIL